MNGLLPLDNLSLQPITGDILALNETSWQHGLTLTEEQARDLSETRNKALKENDRIEFGSEVLRKIVERFCVSRYLDSGNYADVLNEITYYFYYIKAETDDRISDDDLVEEMFKRFELFARGDIDRFEAKEIERIIRKVNLGKEYTSVYGEDDVFDPFTFGRETPQNLIDEELRTDTETEEEGGKAAEEIARDAFIDLDPFEESEEKELSGWANEDDLSLYDEIGEETLEEDDAGHPMNAGGKDKDYFSMSRLTGREPDLPPVSDLKLPGGASLSVGDAYGEDFAGFENDEKAFLEAFGKPEEDGGGLDLDRLDALMDRIAESGGGQEKEDSDE